MSGIDNSDEQVDNAQKDFIGPRPGFPTGLNRGLVNDILNNRASREALSPAQREAAAQFYEQTAPTARGRDFQLYNLARANYLRNGGTPPGTIHQWRARNNK